MTETQNYERLEKLYNQLGPEGQATMRDIYPECFILKLPTTLDEVYEAAGMQTTMQVNIPIYAASRLKSFVHMLNLEAALNGGVAGKHVVSIRTDGELIVAFHSAARDSEPAYRLPIYLDLKKMEYIIATFPQVIKNLFS